MAKDLLKEKDFIDIFRQNAARLITLRNSNGLVAQFTNYGARWVSMLTPDRRGEFGDIVLGFETLSGYVEAKEQYHGAIVGRVCGRISNAQFFLDKAACNLAANDVYGTPVRNHLHGGVKAFHNRLWEVKEAKNDSVVFSLFSPDGEEGYPGNLSIQVAYTLTQENSIQLECTACTDSKTPVNITNHTFFNLCPGREPASVLSHLLTINSRRVITCDSELIPTGQIESVGGYFLDFSTPKIIAESISSANDRVKNDRGFSVAFVLDKKEDTDVAAILEDRKSGRRVTIYTNQPSIQAYNGYFMNGEDIGKGNKPYYESAGIAIEPQGYPDAVNQPAFPDVFIDKHDIYRHFTEYRFETIG